MEAEKTGGLWKVGVEWAKDEKCGGEEAMEVDPKPMPPPTHTVVMTFREPDLKRRIFFFRACDALIFTKTLAGPAGVATPAAPPGPDGEAPAAATSC